MNIFDVLNPRWEESHTRLLAWFLNPDEEHGAGDKFLKQFLQFLGIKYEKLERIECEVYLEGKNGVTAEIPDILIETQGLCVLVENKIRLESIIKEQLENQNLLGRKYARKKDKKFYHVFLTPKKSLKEEIREVIKKYEILHMVWDDVIEILKNIESKLVMDYVNYIENLLSMKIPKFENEEYKRLERFLSDEEYDDKDIEDKWITFLERIKDEITYIFPELSYLAYVNKKYLYFAFRRKDEKILMELYAKVEHDKKAYVGLVCYEEEHKKMIEGMVRQVEEKIKRDLPSARMFSPSEDGYINIVEECIGEILPSTNWEGLFHLSVGKLQKHVETYGRELLLASFD